LIKGVVELTNFGGVHRRLDGVRIHQSDFVTEGELTIVEGIRVTTAARTVLDLAAQLSPYLLARVMADFQRRHLCAPADIDRLNQRIGGRGRPGTVAIRALLAAAQSIEPGDSDLEMRILGQLLAAGVPPAVQQFQVVVGGQVYVLDLAWPTHKVGVEIDGFESRATREALEHDTQRSNALLNAGWDIYHATARTDVRTVAAQVHRAILRRHQRGESPDEQDLR
jgi:very-short-patch-repair endonuclease